MIRLYELCGDDPELLFSPYCWRIRAVLTHLNLPFESVPVRFTEKETLGFSGQGLVPVLVKDEEVVIDSLQIMAYLDSAVSESDLLGTDVARARALSMDAMISALLRPHLSKLLIPTIFSVIAEKDRGYFRETREKRLGCTLESMPTAEAILPDLAPGFSALNAALAESTYLDGVAPGATDFSVYGLLMWAYTLGFSPWQPYAEVTRWFDDLLAAYESRQGPVKRAVAQ
ncbi:glutathione S-transferase family protein [Pokkaliibacter sp. CJK22405]|uniref:glutathione S-transferase family protein n=1 Tax=Pokkaliibacter sp. CJK22405 TaxID=3384615 RepID=UPI003984B373